MVTLGRYGWLAAALAFAAFSVGNTTFQLAGWLAPVLMLRFLRTTTPLAGLALGAAAFVLAHNIGWRGAIIFEGPTYHLVAGGVGLIFFVPFVIDRILSPRIAGFASTLVFPSAVVATEYLWAQAGLGSWGASAYTQWGQSALLQSLSLGGLWMLAFVIAWTASAANLLWARGWKDRPARFATAAAVGLAAVMLCFGGLRLALDDARQPTVRIAGVVVENLDVFQATWGPLARGQQLTPAMAEQARPDTRVLFRTLLDETRRQAQAGADIVVWSEANALVLQDDETILLNWAAGVARQEQVYLFASLAVITPGEPLAQNKVVAIRPDGRIESAYLKSHPTPVETSRRGDGRMPIMDTPHGRIAWAICYDFDFTSFTRQAGRGGADIMLNPSWDSRGMDPMHSHMAAMRAVENGAAMVRITNNGLSLAVDALGRPLGVMQAGGAAVRSLVVDVPTRGVRTAYAFAGDWLAGMSLLLLLALTILALGGRRGRS